VEKESLRGARGKNRGDRKNHLVMI